MISNITIFWVFLLGLNLALAALFSFTFSGSRSAGSRGSSFFLREIVGRIFMAS